MQGRLLLGVVSAAGCASTADAPFDDVAARGAIERTSLDAVFDELPRAGGRADVRPLLDNVPSWVARWQLLRDAKETLDITYFVLDDDAVGLAFLGRVIERAQEGVKVRLLLDMRGTAVAAPRYVFGTKLKDVTRQRPIEVRVIGAVGPRTRQALRHVDPSPLVASQHDKLTIADGRAAILGGRNISHHYAVAEDDAKNVYSDIDLLVEGREVVSGLEAAFEREWVTAAGLPRSSSKRRPDRGPAFMAVAQAMDRWLAEATSPSVVAAEAERLAVAATSPAQALVDATLGEGAERRVDLAREVEPSVRQIARYSSLPREAHRQRPRFTVEAKVLDSPTRPLPARGDESNQPLVDLMRAAEREIVILNPYVVLTETAFAQVRRVCDRGVSIKVLTNSPTSTDSLFTQALFLRMWPEILAACPTARLFVMAKPRTAHGKVAVIDGEVTLLGSYNLDYLSAYTNGEVGVAVRSPTFGGYMRAWILDRIAAGPPDVLEYEIVRDEEGRAVRYPAWHPKRGTPKVRFGPADHCPASTLLVLRSLQTTIDLAAAPFFVDPLM